MPTNPVTAPLPGDFGVVRIRNRTGWLIGLASYLYDGNADYDHAFIVIDNGLIVQGQPHGAGIGHVTDWPNAVYSTGKIPLTDAQRKAITTAAKSLEGTPYGWWDYLSLVLHRFHIRPRIVERKVNDGSTLICSQLVDLAYQMAGVHLFDDGRLPGDVTPGDLGGLL